MPSPSSEQGALRAPWTPDAQLVYAKDSVEFFSEEFADDAAATPNEVFLANEVAAILCASPPAL